MPYQLFWQIPNSVLCLKLGNYATIEDFNEINRQVNSYLDERSGSDSIVFLIDAVHTQRIPQELSSMKTSQTYANRRDVKFILIVSKNKTLRLIMLLTFNLCEAILKFADDEDGADRFLKNMHFAKR